MVAQRPSTRRDPVDGVVSRDKFSSGRSSLAIRFLTTVAPSGSKQQLRKQLCAARRQLTRAETRDAALRLRRLAMRAGWLLRGRRFAFYLPHGGEMDLLPLLNTALQRGKQCYLPIVPRRLGRPMRFARLGASTRWYDNRFGIPENHDPHPLSARNIDVMFMPLVAFDATGDRLGMGGGFYDATLAFLRTRRVWRKPLLIGAAYQMQKVDCLPSEAWDVRLDYVITEQCIYRIKRDQP